MPGSVAFKLDDTYGIPLDLTQDALRARALHVDVEGFQSAMDRQRAEARKAWAGSGELATEALWFAIKEKTGATEFLGYDMERAEGLVAAILKDGKEVPALGPGEAGSVILNQTPFYAEFGGQVGDTGVMHASGIRFRVDNTQKKLGTLFVHEGLVEGGELRVGLALELVVDHERRQAVRANHSATHLLHEALRQVLGEHVAQKGSLVAPDRLRFDFTHQKAIGSEELARIEDIANRAVLDNTPVVTRLMSIDEAIGTGARALFGEKYSDEVRVVSMGHAQASEDDLLDSHEPPFSIELCGGNFMPHALAISASSRLCRKVRLQPVSAASKPKPRRRRATISMRGRTGCMTSQHFWRSPEEEADKRLASLIEESRRLERELSDARRKLALGGPAAESAQPMQDIGGVKFLARVVSGVALKDLKSLADEAKLSVGSGVVAIVGIDGDGKAGIVVGVTPDLTGRFDAVQLVRPAAVKLGGKGGGGRPDMAQAGGPHGTAAEAALAAIGDALRETGSVD